MRLLAPLAAATLLCGCATTNATPGDPYEKFNRSMWSFDRGADRIVVKPVTKVYRAVTPKPLRQGVSHFFANVEEPYSALNAFLQGDPKRGFRSLKRFVVNTTIGIGGLFDPATRAGIKPAPEDLGQTFAVWGAKKSTYLVLPLLGPSTVRDGIGSLAGRFIDPYRLCLSYCGFSNSTIRIGAQVLELLDTRSQLIDAGADTLLDTSADSYAVARSAYLQRREALIANRDDDAASSSPAGGTGSDDASLDAALKDIDQNGNGAAPAATTPATTPPAAMSPADTAPTPPSPAPSTPPR